MYNNDPKFMNPQQGLASLVNSPYRDSDVMQVKMTPNEVAGLQQLALHYGANEQDLYDPVTGQPKFSFLKKLLPTIAGAILNTVAPGVGGAVGKFFGLSGAAASTLGTSRGWCYSPERGRSEERLDGGSWGVWRCEPRSVVTGCCGSACCALG